MRFPRELEIGEHLYRILLLGELRDEYAGLCYLNDKVILIDVRQDSTQIWSTHAHELLHAIETEARIELGHKLINKMEGPLGQILRQHAELAPGPRQKRRT